MPKLVQEIFNQNSNRNWEIPRVRNENNGGPITWNLLLTVIKIFDVVCLLFKINLPYMFLFHAKGLFQKILEQM